MGGYFPGDYFSGGVGTTPVTPAPVISSDLSAFSWRSADGETLSLSNYFTSNYLVRGLQGVTAPQSETILQSSPFQDGYTILRVELPGRTIAFDLDVIGNTRQDLEIRKRLIGRIFSGRRLNGGTNLGTLTLTTASGTVYSVQCVPYRIEDSGDRSPVFQRYSIELLAEDSFFLGSNQTVPLVEGAGLTFPLIFPLVFIGGEILIDLQGDIPVFPIIQVDGPATNPEILNLTTGKTIRANVVVPSGQRLNLDHRWGQKTAKFISLSDGVELDQFDKLSTDSEFWWLQTGENRIQFTKDAGGGVGTVIYQPKFQSVGT